MECLQQKQLEEKPPRRHQFNDHECAVDNLGTFFVLLFLLCTQSVFHLCDTEDWNNWGGKQTSSDVSLSPVEHYVYFKELFRLQVFPNVVWNWFCFLLEHSQWNILILSFFWNGNVKYLICSWNGNFVPQSVFPIWVRAMRDSNRSTLIQVNLILNIGTGSLHSACSLFPDRLYPRVFLYL